MLVGTGNPGGVGPADETVYLDEVVAERDRDHLVHERVAHDGLCPGIGVGHGGQGKGIPAVDRQREGDPGIGHGDGGNHGNDMARLRTRGPEELPAGGHIVEQLRYGDRRTACPTGVRNLRRRTPVDADAGPGRFAFRIRRQVHAGYGGDAGQRLAPKAEGTDAVEVVFAGDLAGSMPLEGQYRVLPGHACAVVHDADELLSARLDLHGNALATGVDRVLGQFLHDRGGAFNHLARGDHVRQLLGQHLDLISHASPALSTFIVRT